MTLVTYTRDASGVITRTHSRVNMRAADRAAEYPHAETLMGWPESRVYWRDASGRSVGVAPLPRQ
jgi:hypothetical protein